MSNVRLELRLVNSSSEGIESRLLWEWRNDPLTRKMSREPAEISWENHKNWFRRVDQDPKKLIFIAYGDSVPVGMIRFDWIDRESAEININLSPEKRGN